MLFFLTFFKESLSTTVFNIDKKWQMFLKQQLWILEWFLKDHVTLKTAVMADEN